MAYLCPHPCDGKTEYGYCRYTWCINPLHSNLGTAYQGQGVQKCIITNADRIRSMTVDELAEFLQDIAMFGGVDTHGIKPISWLDWLREEVADGEQS